jgi:hypothetical protein
MRKTAFSITAVFFALALFSSCKKSDLVLTATADKTEEVSDPVISNNRFVFASHKSFYTFVDRIDNNDPTVATFLENKKDFASLYSRISAYYSIDEEIPESLSQYLESGLPASFQKVLNSDGEIEIGDQIIWYNNGFKYFINKTDQVKLKEIKNNPGRADVEKTPFGSKITPLKVMSTAGARTWMGLDRGPDARWQREFWQYAPAAGWRKYVHEIQAYTEANSNGYLLIWNTRVLLRIKMEWKGRTWKPAGEAREVSYSLTCNNVLLNAPPFGYGIPPNSVFTGTVTQSGDVQRMIAQASGSGTFLNMGWDVDIRGTIYQHVAGDVQTNEWYNTANPLW